MRVEVILEIQELCYVTFAAQDYQKGKEEDHELQGGARGLLPVMRCGCRGRKVEGRIKAPCAPAT